MRKRLLFISVVVLVLSSVATADPWDWLWGDIWGLSGPFGQWQVGYVTAGIGLVNVGTGTASRSQGDTYERTQDSLQGMQSSTISVGQSGSVTGYGAGSIDAVFSQIQVMTYQKQRY